MRQLDLRATATWQKLSPSQRKHIEHRAIKVDTLAAWIEVCRFRVRIETAMLEIEQRKRVMADPKNPKLRGLISGIKRFHHDVDQDVEAATKQLEQAHGRRKNVFTKVHDHIVDRVADLNEVEIDFDALEKALGDNGPPLDSDSTESSEGSGT